MNTADMLYTLVLAKSAAYQAIRPKQVRPHLRRAGPNAKRLKNHKCAGMSWMRSVLKTKSDDQAKALKGAPVGGNTSKPLKGVTMGKKAFDTEPAKKVFRGVAGGLLGARVGSAVGRGAGRLAGAATGISAHQHGGSSPIVALLVGEGASQFLSQLGGMVGGGLGAYKGWQVGTEKDNPPAKETTKAAALGFLAAQLERTEDSQGHEKVAWTGIPQKARGKIAEELWRISGLTGIAGGPGDGNIKAALDHYADKGLPRTLGQYEGSYSISDMMGIMEESGRLANPEAARKMKETL